MLYGNYISIKIEKNKQVTAFPGSFSPSCRAQLAAPHPALCPYVHRVPGPLEEENCLAQRSAKGTVWQSRKAHRQRDPCNVAYHTFAALSLVPACTPTTWDQGQLWAVVGEKETERWR